MLGNQILTDTYLGQPKRMSRYFMTLVKLGLNEIYVWFLLPTYPNFFNPTLNIKMVFGEKYLKWALFQILSLFSLLNVITKFNNFPT